MTLASSVEPRPVRSRRLARCLGLSCALVAGACLFGRAEPAPAIARGIDAGVAVPGAENRDGSAATPGLTTPRSTPARRVLRRVDEKGVTHYVIEPAPARDDSSSLARPPSATPGVARPTGPALDVASGSAFFAVATRPAASPLAAAPVATAAAPPLATAAVASTAVSTPAATASIGLGGIEGYAASADLQGTAATIRELESQIARDREALKQIISEGSGGPKAVDDPRLREIAERLPRLQAELEALRTETRP